MPSDATRLVRIDGLSVPLDAEADDPDALPLAVAAKLGLDRADVLHVEPLKRSIDTRHAPRLIYAVHARVPARATLPRGVHDADPLPTVTPRRVPAHRRDARVLIVGAGPAGLFAALLLARSGLKPIVVEQGKPVEARARDVSRLMHWGQLQASSNLCFGEGGAGTWSDGKLTTRIGAPQVRFVLETLVEMGGPERILLDGKPHLGTDRLIAILKRFRAGLSDAGADLRFNTCVAGLRTSPRGDRVAGVTLSDGAAIDADAVVLASGHSSRPLYAALLQAGVHLEPKPFAVGFRVEHPQATINQIQYRHHADNPLLPAADYRLTANLTLDGQPRGVYSFCMCPGGQVVPTPTEPGGVVVNGMSHAARSGPFANSALVVTVNPQDYGAHHPLAGIDFQRRAERAAGALGGGLFRAPAQTLTGFLDGRLDADLRKSSYTPGVTPADLARCYPDFVNASLRAALTQWRDRMPAFVTQDALLIGVETRTSAPVRVTRHDATLDALSLPGLYPCGEGAGYGGGIVSAAVDGLRVASAILDALGAEPAPPLPP